MLNKLLSQYQKKFFSYAKNQKLEFLSLLFLVLIASILRLWNIEGHMTFLGDEGRDALVLLNIFQEGRLTLLGPSASVGGFFLGPAYYYLVIPGFLLFGMSPVGMAFEVAVLGFATVIILYLLIKKYLGFLPAILATLLYSVSPVVVMFSRSSWNPNILPFLSLLIFVFLLLSKEKNKIVFSFAVGAIFGLAIQSHYLGLILALPIFIITTIFSINNISRLIKIYLITFLGFLFTFSPYFLFELRHGFKNTSTIIEFVTKPSGAVGIREFQFGDNALSAISRLFRETLSITNSETALFVGLATLLLAVISVGFFKSKKISNFYLVVIIWALSGILGLAFYNGELYNYYFSFLFPVPFLLLSLIFFIFKNQKIVSTILIVCTFALIAYLLPKNIIFKQESNQLKTAKSVSNKVLELAGGRQYNFALMASGNTDYAYRFFLEKNNFAPTPIENQITDQLIVVCEEKDCRYNLSPMPQILSFGPRQLDQEIDFIPGHIKIFRLIHEPSK
ncbi:glycosyltransferase family 39 protein [Candidatus Curtissbacteria bacterium]|nr:glycosyltransferase family 39 protein [Candidatus Curtissbacteria bacterium]